MVKAALKAAPPSARVLQRCLTARQLGLKLIANVTYGAQPESFLPMLQRLIFLRTPRRCRLHRRQLQRPHAAA